MLASGSSTNSSIRRRTGPTLSAEQCSEDGGVFAEGFFGEAFDSGPEAVPVDAGPLDAAVWRVWVVFDGELDHAGEVVVGQPGGEAQGGVDASGDAGTGEVAAVL